MHSEKMDEQLAFANGDVHPAVGYFAAKCWDGLGSLHELGIEI
jgi:hypothetical protein